MVSQICDQCGATVAADEQFCPECGGFIDPMTTPRQAGPRPARSTPRGNVISVTSDGATDASYEEFSLSGEPPTEPETSGPEDSGTGKTATCPSCGAVNPFTNRHCQECGSRLRQGPLPTAPRPAVQATAGVRAAFAISGLLFVVIVVAVLFNVFGREGTAAPATTTTTTTEQVMVEPDVIDILDVTCSVSGISSFVCANVVGRTTDEYQVNWEELEQSEESLTIRLSFRQPMNVIRIDWTNITDPVRFRQNYRARGLILDAQNSIQEWVVQLDDSPATQTVDFAAVNASWIEITVESAYNAEVVDGEVWRDLAIQDITVIGRPTNPTVDNAGNDD